ncbi:hypothetical protein ACQEXU_10910 [Vibrio sp. TRT 21S02]|uniref:hypothetical protein n=1 Tax=Vibrio sp. TRT 21S02 TaxID=3418507 RepID=UPI003CEB43AC
MFGEYTPLMKPKLLQRRLASGKAQIDPILGLEKYCARCREYWPQDTLFWTPMRTRPDGLQDWCKCCQLEVRNAANRAKALAKKAA